MKQLSERKELRPDQERYSVVKLDTWKAPTDDEFALKVGEINSLDEAPITAAGRGEEIVILDAEGTPVSATEGPDHPTETTVRDGPTDETDDHLE